MTTNALNKLPHGEPFRFLSSVSELETGRRGKGAWQVTGKEAFLLGHFPDNPVVPGVLIAEALAQLAGIVAFADAGGVTGRLAQVNVKLHQGVIPPAIILLEAVLTRSMSSLYLFEVRADVHGETVASGTLVLANARRNDHGQGAAG